MITQLGLCLLLARPICRHPSSRVPFHFQPKRLTARRSHPKHQVFLSKHLKNTRQWLIESWSPVALLLIVFSAMANQTKRWLMNQLFVIDWWLVSWIWEKHGKPKVDPVIIHIMMQLWCMNNLLIILTWWNWSFTEYNFLYNLYYIIPHLPGEGC
jgi:hypothetical protein